MDRYLAGVEWGTPRAKAFMDITNLAERSVELEDTDVDTDEEAGDKDKASEIILATGFALVFERIETTRRDSLEYATAMEEILSIFSDRFDPNPDMVAILNEIGREHFPVPNSPLNPAETPTV